MVKQRLVRTTLGRERPVPVRREPRFKYTGPEETNMRLEYCFHGHTGCDRDYGQALIRTKPLVFIDGRATATRRRNRSTQHNGGITARMCQRRRAAGPRRFPLHPRFAQPNQPHARCERPTGIGRGPWGPPSFFGLSTLTHGDRDLGHGVIRATGVAGGAVAEVATGATGWLAQPPPPELRRPNSAATASFVTVDATNIVANPVVVSGSVLGKSSPYVAEFGRVHQRSIQRRERIR